MDIGLLERSNHVKPLLVKLYDTHHVYKLAGDKAPDARSELGEIVSELLDVSVDAREKDLVADILLALIQQAETHLRKTLAEKLSQNPDVPARLILNLAYDDIEVAESVLRKSPVLEALDLMYVLQSKPVEYAEAIATRSNLPEAIIDELIDMKDQNVDAVLAGNSDVALTEPVLEKLYESAKRSDVVAEPLVSRQDVPKQLIKKLYRFVGDSLKIVIQEKYGVVGDAVEDVVQEAVDECIGQPDTHLLQYLPSHAMMISEKTKLQIRNERESQIKISLLKEMVSALQLKKYKVFVAKFAICMGVEAEDALEILSQQYGHGLAILTRAHSVDRNDFIKIFLLSDKIRSSAHVMQGNTLNRALAYYDRLSVDMARDLYAKNFLNR